MLTLSVHYEPLNSNQPYKYDHVVEFLLFSCKRLLTVTSGMRIVKDLSLCTMFGDVLLTFRHSTKILS